MIATEPLALLGPQGRADAVAHGGSDIGHGVDGGAGQGLAQLLILILGLLAHLQQTLAVLAAQQEGFQLPVHRREKIGEVDAAGGKIEGKIEGKAEVAKNLIAMGQLSYELIAQATGLTSAEVAQLAAS